MKMSTSDAGMRKFRRAFKKFLTLKYNYRIDQGDFDSLIKKFLEGDALDVTMKIQFLPNDILFMRSLAGMPVPATVRSKVYALWDEERRRP